MKLKLESESEYNEKCCIQNLVTKLVDTRNSFMRLQAVWDTCNSTTKRKSLGFLGLNAENVDNLSEVISQLAHIKNTMAKQRKYNAKM